MEAEKETHIIISKNIAKIIYNKTMEYGGTAHNRTVSASPAHFAGPGLCCAKPLSGPPFAANSARLVREPQVFE
jgi:hypothetical protein